MGNRLGIALGALAVIALAGCGGSKKKVTDAKTAGPADNPGEIEVPNIDKSLCDTDGKSVGAFDLNRDGKPDVWKLFKSFEDNGTKIDVLTCKQVDLDHDGRKDYVILFDDNGGKIAEYFDFDFDGQFDATHYYEGKSAQVYLVERDSDFDKKPDIWEKYAKGGGLDSVRRDRNADGKPDVWEQYKDGQLIAILYDDDFDARVDRRDEVAAKPKSLDQTPSAPAPGGGDGTQPAAEPPAEPPGEVPVESPGDVEAEAPGTGASADGTTTANAGRDS
jgi:hypothetical protein